MVVNFFDDVFSTIEFDVDVSLSMVVGVNWYICEFVEVFVIVFGVYLMF